MRTSGWGLSARPKSGMDDLVWINSNKNDLNGPEEEIQRGSQKKKVLELPGYTTIEKNKQTNKHTKNQNTNNTQVLYLEF